MKLRSFLLSVAVAASACGGAVHADSADDATANPAAASMAAAGFMPEFGADTGQWQRPTAQSEGDIADSLIPLSARIVELPQAAGIPEIKKSPVPTSMSFQAVGLYQAPIEPVGVLANGEMAVPGASGIGWYRFGPVPGEVGSAVLAAHIAFDGKDGAFRFLGSSQVGDRFSIAFDDNSEQTYEIFEKAQYGKADLPFDRVFARDGRAVVTLISCGGTFQSSIGSYEDNIVAYAVVVD